MITRRDLLRGVAGTVGLLGWSTRTRFRGAATGDDETEAHQVPSLCLAPQYIVREATEGRGLQDVQYVQGRPRGYLARLGSGEVDVTLHFVAPLVIRLDESEPGRDPGRGRTSAASSCLARSGSARSGT